ncbi:MAG: PAS domain S-box protein [Ilumatobacteraceae bacterium]
MADAPHPRPLDLALPFEAHIRLEPALLRRVFDVNPDGVLVIDDDGVVAAANPAAVALTGYPHERLVGLRVDELVQIEARQRHRDLRMDAQRERVERPMSASTTLTLARADGVLVPVEIALNAIDGSGDYMAVIRDVTERVKIKDRLELSEEVVLLARERERIARDLHDTVLQRLFGLGLELQAAGMRAEPATAERLGNAVDEIDLVIREIRTAVFTLGAAHREGSFGQELGILIAQSSRLLGFTPHLRIDGPLEAVLTPEVRVEMVASMREALGNVARHAAATEAHVEVSAGEWITVRITDNGRGLVNPERVLRGNGLRNLRHRAELLGGHCEIANRPSGGTELVWTAPAHGSG